MANKFFKNKGKNGKGKENPKDGNQTGNKKANGSNNQGKPPGKNNGGNQSNKKTVNHNKKPNVPKNQVEFTTSVGHLFSFGNISREFLALKTIGNQKISIKYDSQTKVANTTFEYSEPNIMSDGVQVGYKAPKSCDAEEWIKLRTKFVEKKGAKSFAIFLLKLKDRLRMDLTVVQLSDIVDDFNKVKTLIMSHLSPIEKAMLSMEDLSWNNVDPKKMEALLADEYKIIGTHYQGTRTEMLKDAMQGDTSNYVPSYKWATTANSKSVYKIVQQEADFTISDVTEIMESGII